MTTETTKLTRLLTVQERKFNKFYNKLRNGAVRFGYKKVDGTLTCAYGSINRAAVKQLCGVKIDRISKSDKQSCQKYFDLDTLAWRSFVKVNFICVIE